MLSTDGIVPQGKTDDDEDEDEDEDEVSLRQTHTLFIFFPQSELLIHLFSR
jgi:hypothetical protein